MRIRLLTYNIHGLPWIRMDLSKILIWLFTVPRADIICLQEVWSEEDRKQIAAYARNQGWHTHSPYDPAWLGSLLRGMTAGSGLCILTKSSFQLARPSIFKPFSLSSGVDAIMSKGYYMTTLRCKGKVFNLINTHMQSDFTEFSCCRVNYLKTRKLQEMELYHFINTRSDMTLLIGDMNTAIFKWFERVDPHDHVTFPETEEHLDHLICLKSDMSKISHITTDFYDSVMLSDHIPIVYEIDI